MDTEWDRCCASALLSVGRSTSQLEQLTWDATTANRAKVFVEEALDEIDNDKIAAEDMVKLRTESTIKNLETQINENRKLHSQRTDRWTDEQLNALSEKEELLSLRLDEQQELLQKQSKNPLCM